MKSGILHPFMRRKSTWIFNKILKISNLLSSARYEHKNLKKIQIKQKLQISKLFMINGTFSKSFY